VFLLQDASKGVVMGSHHSTDRPPRRFQGGEAMAFFRICIVGEDMSLPSKLFAKCANAQISASTGSNNV
jgi:hypothetical protein